MASSGARTHMSIALAFAVATLLTTSLLWVVTTWAGAAVPVLDAVIIAALCTGLAMLPSVGWVLATLIMSILITRLTDADAWPDTVLMVVGSNVVWLTVKMLLGAR